MTGARTESTDIAWKDCADFIGSKPDWVFWHHWPDHRLHDHDDAGKGLSTLTREVREHLISADFWSLVERLATGRRVIITTDHGYAASGLFPIRLTTSRKDSRAGVGLMEMGTQVIGCCPSISP